MPVTDPTATSVVDLSRAEQWVVHHVLLDALGLADGDIDGRADTENSTQPNLDAIEKLEAGTFEFTQAELACIRRACGAHARVTEATADHNLASAVVDRIDVTLQEASQ